MGVTAEVWRRMSRRYSASMPDSLVAGPIALWDTPAEWDAVVSCFFLDTAPNIIEYLETIFAMLKPGGFLINFGERVAPTQAPCATVGCSPMWSVRCRPAVVSLARPGSR